jgi:acyl-coenzyme A thioesterase PaaI-like protein
MTAKAADKLKSDGWKIVETTGFLHLIGPLWQRVVDGNHEYALLTEDKHHNRRGLVQGGVIMTFADRTCGMTARFVSGKPTLATCSSIPTSSRPAGLERFWCRGRTWCARPAA